MAGLGWQRYNDGATHTHAAHDLTLRFFGGTAITQWCLSFVARDNSKSSKIVLDALSIIEMPICVDGIDRVAEPKTGDIK